MSIILDFGEAAAVIDKKIAVFASVSFNISIIWSCEIRNSFLTNL